MLLQENKKNRLQTPQVILKCLPNALIKHAKRIRSIVAITAAMPSGTGLDIFEKVS